MSYVAITKRIRDSVRVIFPKAKFQFRLEYFDDGTCMSSASSDSFYFYGIGHDSDVAVNKMLENFKKYLDDVAAKNDKMLADAHEQYEKMANGINRARLTVAPELYECDSCSRKPGSPTLCETCLANRAKAGNAWRGPRPRSDDA